MADGTVPLARLAMDEAVGHERSRLERIHQDVRRALLALPAVAGGEGIRHAGTLREAGEWLAGVMRRLDQLAGRRKRIEDELALISRYGRVMESLAPLLRRLPPSDDLEYFGLTLERKDPEAIQRVRAALGALTRNRFELLLVDVDADLTAGILVCPKPLSTPIKVALSEHGVGEMPVPVALADRPWSRAVAIVLRRRIRLPVSLDRVRRAFAESSRRWRPSIEALDRAIANRLGQIEAMAWFYQTERAFVIDGWAPRAAVAGLRERLQRELDGTVVVTLPDARADATLVPVALANPSWMRPFERLVRVIALPRYGTIDPTPYLAVGFPLFFGLIVGDVGYGAILLALAFALRRRYPQHPLIRQASRIGLPACAWAVVFGVLYGECFGTLGTAWGLRPVLIDRLHAFTGLLIAALGLGVLHVGLGIVLGLWTALRARAWLEVRIKIGGALVLAGAAAWAAAIGGGAPAWAAWPAAGAVAIGVLTLASARRARAFMELHNLVNVLSYLRLMGIGVASAALAFAANRLGEMSGSVAASILIGVIVHGINLAFAVISPTIQSLRLHYVEFFENFFQAGGREYRPFQRIEAIGEGAGQT
ncbi:MAG: V-type ATPase 116kDa subunit family protein [Nitrospiria bacterium]